MFKNGNVAEEDYNKHIEAKNKARAEKERDKAQALEGKCHVITMDVQYVKLLPQIPASTLYYKTKLCCHNFTIYDLATKGCVCFWYNETQTDGQASTYASFLLDFLEETFLKGRSVPGKRSSDESQHESEEVSDSSADHSEQEMAHEEVDEEVGYEVADADITSGEFVLVCVMSGERKSVSYRYVAIVQDVLPDDEYNLLGLKSLDATEKTFVGVENDLFTATLDAILAILSKPLLNIKHLRGPRTQHVSSKNIDVFET
ncbi:unnamed protein product [Phaedon cochleariae]|uniref:Uncharacterized protein n=1 Tax=Phaedon cochleariae TaxID=80249 RepID=A0A9N9SKV5_PHACE|nr:unnamed protein product [Phaedon cochleariae]